MKVLSNLLALFLVFSFPVAPCFAQGDSLNNKSPKEIRMQVSVGNFELNGSPVSLEDWKKLASSSTFLKEDFSKFSQDKNYITDLKPFFNLNFYINTTQINNPNKGGGWIKTGLSFGQLNLFDYRLEKKIITPFDTLSSTLNSLEIYVDSIQEDELRMHYTSSVVQAEIGYIFRTKEASRWGLYGGAGVGIGYTFNNYVSLTKENKKYFEYRLSNGENFSDESRNHENQSLNFEEFRLKSSFIVSAFLPVGVTFRVGKKSAFLRKLTLSFEYQAGVQMRRIPELENFVNPYGLSQIGLIVNLD